MSTATQRWTLAGLFLGVGLVSLMGATAATRIASGYLALPDGAEVADVEAGEVFTPEDDGRPARSKRPRRASKRSYVDTIVERSLFDSTNVGKKSTGDGPVDTSGGQKTDLKVVLLATVVSDDAQYSSALISDEKDGARGYGVEGNLMDEATIVAIEPRKVVIKRNDGSIEYIEMDEEAEPPRRAGMGRKPANDEDSPVESQGNNKFVVDAEALEKIMENPEQLYSQIRVVPHKDANGEVDGYRLSGIRRKSFFYQLGVKNGDIVHSVNGKPLTSASSGMDAYNSLADAKDFTFDITRRNKKQTFEYEVR